ncbi:uncharacterized protein LOC144437075 [Glandiceps talaboti]
MTYFKTVQTMLAVLVGSLRDAGGSIFAASPTIAQGFMVVYIFFESWVLLMLLLSVLNMACTDAKCSDEINRQDDIVDIAHDWMKDSTMVEFLTGGTNKKAKNQLKGIGKGTGRPRLNRNSTKRPQGDPIKDLEVRLLIIEKKTNILIKESEDEK